MYRKLILYCFIALSFPIASLHAEELQTVPFASDLTTSIKHYNKLLPDIATSGVVGTGGYKELSELGVKTFIDLRTPEEINSEQIKAEFEGKNSKYINIPVFGSEGISQAQVEKFSLIYETAEKPMLINCASGNRAGALWTAYSLRSGSPLKLSIEQGRTAGLQTSLEKDVIQKFYNK